MTDRELIKRIEVIRAQNNGHWMDLMRLAFELDPVRARAIMRDIVELDKNLRFYSQRLAKGAG